ncbi:cyclic nucleotide-binding domain-containing protein [Candidatus Gracilibacteria bacterium]|nr:cyclic nucleotide-binding domain-containing protein [Candidatus Gracilibacteria bacterium]
MQNIYDLEIFSGIEKDIVDEILKSSKIERFSFGEYVILQGDESNGKGYIIKSGEVLVEINNQEIKKLSTGEIFGEIALLNEEQRVASIKVISENAEFLILSQDDLIEMVNNGSELINKNIMQRLEENLKNNY